MYEEVGEKVKVLAEFNDGLITPRVFKWSGKDNRIKKVNLFYQERHGKTVNYYFSVETNDGGVYKLKYNDEKLIWTLEELWIE
jgi:hypothetical protein